MCGITEGSRIKICDCKPKNKLREAVQIKALTWEEWRHIQGGWQ
jgi:hypothetical protein